MKRLPVIHRMDRRSAVHNYRRPGIYHITIRVADGLGCPLGKVVGSHADTAAVELTAAGAAVERELLTAITARYGMISVDAYVVMPEHLHFILNVHAPIVSKSGQPAHLGQVIAGFKQGCNRAYWAVTGQERCAVSPHSAADATGSKNGADSVTGGFGARKERYTTGRPLLFAPGYCDVMPVEPGQLDTMRAYIKDNPRSRWLRTHDRARLQPQRTGIDTALTPTALRRDLKAECPPYQATEEVVAEIERRLMIGDTTDGKTVCHSNGGNTVCHSNGGRIVCHSYGDRALLERRLLPVVCHRKDAPLLNVQKARCLEEAARGAVLVSSRIAKGEQLIIDEAVNRGFATIIIADNGFPEVWHPSEERIARCSEGRLLIVTPWQYHYRHKDEDISVAECKTMNCIAQALCRTRDDWWKKKVQNNEL